MSRLINDRILKSEPISRNSFQIDYMTTRRQKISDLHEFKEFPNILRKMINFPYVHKRLHYSIHNIFLEERLRFTKLFHIESKISLRGRYVVNSLLLLLFIFQKKYSFVSVEYSFEKLIISFIFERYSSTFENFH